MKTIEIKELIEKIATKYSDKEYSAFIRENQVLCSLSSLDKDSFFDNKLNENIEKLNTTTLGQLWVISGAFNVLSVDGLTRVQDTIIRILSLNIIRDERIFVTGILNEFFELFLKHQELKKLKDLVPVKPDLKMYQIKPELLKSTLTAYGFFDLDKVALLTERKKDELVKLLAFEKTPYQIAMLEYLGFLKHTLNNYCVNNQIGENYKLLARILNIGWETIKGNILHLDRPHSRYKTFNHKKTVEADYQNLLF